MDNIKNFNDPITLYQSISSDIVKQAAIEIKTKGNFNIAFPGGETPQTLFKILSSSIYNNQIPWGKVNVFLTDERMVSINHDDSNCGQIQKLLINRIPQQPKLFPMITSDDIEECCKNYSNLISSILPIDKKMPQFDRVILGIGEDGHIASLFPDTDVLQEKIRFVSHVQKANIPYKRITLTYPILTHAKFVNVLAKGKRKANILQKILSNKGSQNLPINALQKAKSVIWYVDRDALPNVNHESNS